MRAKSECKFFPYPTEKFFGDVAPAPAIEKVFRSDIVEPPILPRPGVPSEKLFRGGGAPAPLAAIDFRERAV